MTRARFTLVCLAVFVAACGKKKVKTARGRHAPRPSAPTERAVVGSIETGVASWYGHPYHGRPAADGEIYDMEKLVAAHRTMPFNTWVRVTNLNNSKTVEVRIIDRGPFVGGRIIDLSHAAAQAVDMIGSGIAQVRVEVIAAPQTPEPPVFGVQVGVFANRANADRMMNDLQTRYGSAKLIGRQGNGTTWRVIVGRENNMEDAETLAVKIRSAENLPQAFVVRIDVLWDTL
jgi:rare lipoprotein A